MTLTDGFIQVNGREVVYLARFTKKWVDDTFSHEFGIQQCGHFELDEVEIDTCEFTDNDTPCEVTGRVKDKILADIEGGL